MAKRPLELPVHPTEGKGEGLKNYIRAMPGGKRLDGWEDDERIVVAVWLEADRPRLPLPYIFDAYPPHQSFKGSWSSGYVFHVPGLVAEMITWYSEEHEWNSAVLQPAFGETPEQLIEGYAAVWALMPEDSDEEVLEVHESIVDAALEEGLDVKALRETALVLARDSEGSILTSYEEHLAGAVALLKKG